MIVFLLILILLAILFSTERGRGLLEWLFLLPFKIIGFPFRVAAENAQKQREKQAEKNAEKRDQEIEEFKKTLSHEDAALLVETPLIWMSGGSIRDVQEQISLYKKFKRKEIDRRYLRPHVLITAEGNNSLYLIKPEKIEELRK